MSQALDLSEQYFKQVAEPALQTQLPDLYAVVAAGLVGNGSECFGFDDELSRDHDWGADFFLCLPDSHQAELPRLTQWKQKLFAETPPENTRVQSAYGAQITPLTCGDFYRQLIGTADGTMDLLRWLQIPEANLAMSINGRVFLDNTGEFTRIRNRLLEHYPEDVRKKKIAAKCMAIAQTGQYNLERTAKREDWVTVNTVLTMFNQQVIALVFLLNRVYRPYYKWEYRRLCTLPILGPQIGALLRELVTAGQTPAAALTTRQELISQTCALLCEELKRQGLSQSTDWFLADHGESVQRSIKDERLRRLPAQYE